MAAALVAATQGLGVLDPGFIPAMASAAGDDEAAGRGKFTLVEELTLRELEVLRLMAEGLPNKTIALRLGISEHTVKFHVSGIYTRLGAASRTEAVRLGVRQGLIVL